MMQETEVYASLTEIFHDIFMRDDLVLSAELSAPQVPGWDSFKHIEIIIATEAQFGIKFTTQELESLKAVGDLVRLILSHKA